MAEVTVDWKFNKSGRYKLDITKAIDENTLTQMGNEALKLLKKYVPMNPENGGTLRASGHVSEVNVSDARFYLDWDAVTGSAESKINKTGESYARYIYYGQVMGPNRRRKDKESGELKWYSAASNKSFTGQPMVYHTPDTMDRWDRVIQPGGTEYSNLRSQCKDILVRAMNNG